MRKTSRPPCTEAQDKKQIASINKGCRDNLCYPHILFSSYVHIWIKISLAILFIFIQERRGFIKKKNKSRYKRVAARSSLEKREYIIINLNVSRVILFVPGRRERKNGPGLSDNSADLSPFTTVSRDYRVPIRSRPGGEKRTKKKVHKRTYTYIREHSHPGSDRNGLNAREAPEECRCAYISRDDLFVLASVVRSACETQKRIFYGEISLSLSFSLHLLLHRTSVVYVTHRYS